MFKSFIKTIILFVITFTLFVFAGCVSDKKADSDITASTQESTSNTSINTKSYGDITSTIPEDYVIPQELDITKSSIHKIEYIKNYLPWDLSVQEANTTERMENKMKNINIYIDMLETQPETEIVQDELNDYIADYKDCSVMANDLTICLSKIDNSLAADSTDEEIITFFRNNKYLSVLAKYAGVDLDNAFVLRERCLDNKTEITICNKENNPVDQAFACNSAYLNYFIYDNYDKELVFYGRNYKKYADINGAETDTITVTNEYEQALKQAKEIIESDIEPMSARIVYCVQEKNAVNLPYFRFVFDIDSRTVGVDIPVVISVE